MNKDRYLKFQSHFSYIKACEFMETVNIINDNYYADGSKFLSVLLVNTGFASELFIKSCLIGLDIKYAKKMGHDISYLFNLLPGDLQGCIINEIQCSKEAFSPLVKTVSDSFVEWRYTFEKPGVHLYNLDFSLQLMRAFHKTAQNYQKSIGNH